MNVRRYFSPHFCSGLFVLLMLLSGGCGGRGQNKSFTELGEFFSAELRDLDRKEEEIKNEMGLLPNIPQAPQTSRIGYSSHPDPAPDGKSQFIRLDLGQRERIDQIVLAPAVIDLEGQKSHGFPLNWRLEIAEDASFEGAVVAADYSTKDFPDPGRFPFTVRVNEISGRFVRLTATRLRQGVLALGEFMVLQGDRNLADGLTQEAIRVRDSEERQGWSVMNLVDSQSHLGIPCGMKASYTHGYQSAPAKDRETVKWVQVDLGREAVLEEVRLLPAQSGEISFPGGGFGFPWRYKVETSLEPEFLLPSLVTGFQRRGNPQQNPVPLPVPGLRARYVRLTAPLLNRGREDFMLALAEMQIYSGGENIARGAAVTAQDALTGNGLWEPRFLTDGYTSMKNILTWPEYLALLEVRHKHETWQAGLPQLRSTLTKQVLHRILTWTLAAAVALAVLSAAGLWRNRRLRRREMEGLRRRIARDVHDEIGSGLGTIALLSQMAGGDAANPETARADFMEINRLSREITESLRDIVWFIRPGTRTVEDLAQRLRETTASMLCAVKHDFEADSVIAAHELSLEFKRQVLLFFKEALHNLMRHASAGHALVHVGGDGKRFTLRIEDDGCGFDAARRSSGAGLTGMQQRAATLGGFLTVDSVPGRGTRLRLDVPWP